MLKLKKVANNVYSSLFGHLMNYRKILADFPLPQLFATFVATQRNHTQTVSSNRKFTDES